MSERLSELWGKIQNRYRYFKEKRVTVFVLLSVIALNMLLVILGCLILRLLPDNQRLSLSDTFWESLKLLLDPGGFLGNRLSAVATIITTLIVLCGSITFTGGVIGYVTNFITTKIDEVKSGQRNILIDSAILILNWNDRALSLIIDYYSDPKIDTNDTYFIILSSCESKMVEQQIKRALTDYRKENAIFNNKQPRILVRTGSTTSYSDLDDVNVFFADTIYIFQPVDADDPDYEVMRTYLAVSRAVGLASDAIQSVTEEGDKAEPDVEELQMHTSVVIETTDFATGRLINNYELKTIESIRFTPLTISNEFTLGKLYAQIALMPNVSLVYQELLSTSGSTIVDVVIDEKTPRIEDELTSYSAAIPLYDYSDEDTISRAYLMYGSDISEKGFEKATQSAISSPQIEQVNPDLSLDGRKIIIVGINSKLPYILSSLLAYNRNYEDAPCSVVLVVTEDQADLAAEFYEDDDYKPLFSKSKKYTTITDNYAIEEYVSLIRRDFHSMIVLSLDDVEEDTDKNVIESYMGWSSIIENDDDISKIVRGRIIFEVKEQKNACLVGSDQENLVVVSNRLISLFMVRMGRGETLREIILDMISTDGDTDYEDEVITIRNQCDMLTVRMDKFFRTKDIPLFRSKHDCISQIFKATEGEYIPIGVISGGTLYVFTNNVFSEKDRTELGLEDRPCLSNGYMVERDGTALRYEENVDMKNQLLLKPEDELVVIRRTALH